MVLNIVYEHNCGLLFHLVTGVIWEGVLIQMVENDLIVIARLIPRLLSHLVVLLRRIMHIVLICGPVSQRVFMRQTFLHVDIR